MAGRGYLPKDNCVNNSHSKKATCGDCGTSDEQEFYTTINPEGGYGRPELLVCDACMKSGRWDYWKSQHWPNWPEPRSVAH
jgi:hypothetical protein